MSALAGPSIRASCDTDVNAIAAPGLPQNYYRDPQPNFLVPAVLELEESVLSPPLIFFFAELCRRHESSEGVCEID